MATGIRPDPVSDRAEKRANPTIVGGRPPGAGVAGPGIPSGIDHLLRRAAHNPQLRAEFLERRGAVASSVGITLTPEELVLLLVAPADQLELLLDNLPPEDEKDRSGVTGKKPREPGVIHEIHYPAPTGIPPEQKEYKFKRWQGLDLSGASGKDAREPDAKERIQYPAATGISPQVERLRRPFWLIGVVGLAALLLWWLL